MFGNTCNLLALCVKWSLVEETKGKVGILGETVGGELLEIFPSWPNVGNGEVSNYFYELWPGILMLNWYMYWILTWFGHAWKIWIWVVDKKKKKRKKRNLKFAAKKRGWTFD